MDAKIRLGGFGAEFKRSTLLQVVRQVLGKAVSSAQIESKDGKTWLVTLEAGGIAVAHEGAAVVLPELVSLSPDVNARTQWFEREVAKFRVADEGIRKWQLVLAARPLEDDEFDLLLDEFRLTPAHTAASIGERVRQGNFKPSDLVPSDLRYFHRLVGESASDSSMPAFIATVVASHAQRLVSQNPFEGLKAAFLLSSHHLAAEVIDLGAVPSGDLLHVYEWLVEAGDCISQIGAIECGLRHLDTIPELEPSLIAKVRALAINDAADAGGRLKLLSSLVALVEGDEAPSRSREQADADQRTNVAASVRQRLCCAQRAVVKDQKLVGLKRQLRVRLALVIGELDFVCAVQKLHDRADLATQETVRGDVCEERDDIEQLRCGVHCLSPLLREAAR